MALSELFITNRHGISCRVSGCTTLPAADAYICEKHKRQAERVLKRRGLNESLRLAKREADKSILYFIQAERGGPIKIGITAKRVTRRLKELQVGNPHKLVVLAHMPASPWVEKALHKALETHHVSGEWFSECEEIEAFLAAIKVGRIDLVVEYAEQHGI